MCICIDSYLLQRRALALAIQSHGLLELNQMESCNPTMSEKNGRVWMQEQEEKSRMNLSSNRSRATTDAQTTKYQYVELLEKYYTAVTTATGHTSRKVKKLDRSLRVIEDDKKKDFDTTTRWTLDSKEFSRAKRELLEKERGTQKEALWHITTLVALRYCTRICNPSLKVGNSGNDVKPCARGRRNDRKLVFRSTRSLMI